MAACRETNGSLNFILDFMQPIINQLVAVKTSQKKYHVLTSCPTEIQNNIFEDFISIIQNVIFDYNINKNKNEINYNLIKSNNEINYDLTFYIYRY